MPLTVRRPAAGSWAFTGAVDPEKTGPKAAPGLKTSWAWNARGSVVALKTPDPPAPVVAPGRENPNHATNPVDLSRYYGMAAARQGMRGVPSGRLRVSGGRRLGSGHVTTINGRLLGSVHPQPSVLSRIELELQVRSHPTRTARLPVRCPEALRRPRPLPRLLGCVGRRAPPRRPCTLHQDAPAPRRGAARDASVHRLSASAAAMRQRGCCCRCLTPHWAWACCPSRA